MKEVEVIYLTNDGERFLARDAGHLVTMLRDASRSPAASDRQFMRQVAARTKVQTGADIDCATVESFISGLVKAGLVRVEHNGG